MGIALLHWHALETTFAECDNREHAHLEDGHLPSHWPANPTVQTAIGVWTRHSQWLTTSLGPGRVRGIP